MLGAQGLLSTYEQVHVDLDLLTLTSFIFISISIKFRNKMHKKEELS